MIHTIIHNSSNNLKHYAHHVYYTCISKKESILKDIHPHLNQGMKGLTSHSQATFQMHKVYSKHKLIKYIDKNQIV